jgi:glycine/D-amino acid oxidase-like deaminating enzyme
MVVRLRPSLFWQELRTPRHWSLDAPTPFEAIRVLDPKPSRRGLDRASANLIAAFPGFAGMRIAESWAGLIDVTPDGVPVISPVTALPGFHLASGFSGHGFGIGPGAGRLMADIVTGATPIVDPHPFRLERLAA